MKLILTLVFLFFNSAPAKANFWQSMQSNISKAFKPSKFICDKYEVQDYEVPVLRPGMSLPFTERKTKLRKCKRWENAPKSATGKACKEYEYVNTSSAEQKSFYTTVKRKRTVCVEGHSTR